MGTIVSEVALYEYQGLNSAFVKEALRQWDNLDGKLLPFHVFIAGYVRELWEDFVRKN